MPEYEEKNPLSIISVQMLVWLLFVIAIYVYIVWRQTPLYITNEAIIPKGHSFEFYGLLFFLLTVATLIFQSRRVDATTLRLVFIIFSSVVLLALAVFLTGGFIDSPFSGAITLYMGFFITLARRRVFVVSNLILTALALGLLLLPYVYLYIYSSPNPYIVQWRPEPRILWARLGMNIGLSMAAAVVGAKISDEISKVPGDIMRSYWNRKPKRR